MNPQTRQIHDALLDIVRVMNAPRPDVMLIQEAGVSLDRALFPLLAHLGRRGAMGVVELSDAVGRDYTTVSRQAAKLESLGLIERRSDPADKRVRKAVVTPAGAAINTALDGARDRLFGARLADWSEAEKTDLARLLRKLADEGLGLLNG